MPAAGTASGGQAIARPIPAPHFLDQGVNPEPLRRGVPISSGAFDSLPHNRYAVSTIRAIRHETHRDGYPALAALTVVVPTAGPALCLLQFAPGRQAPHPNPSPSGRGIGKPCSDRSPGGQRGAQRAPRAAYAAALVPAGEGSGMRDRRRSTSRKPSRTARMTAYTAGSRVSAFTCHQKCQTPSTATA